jgi:hypothetical protein
VSAFKKRNGRHPEKTKQKEYERKKEMQSSSSSAYENKELEDFIEGEYISIRDGESRVLEFIKNKTKLVDKTDFNGKPTNCH